MPPAAHAQQPPMASLRSCSRWPWTPRWRTVAGVGALTVTATTLAQPSLTTLPTPTTHLPPHACMQTGGTCRSRFRQSASNKPCRGTTGWRHGSAWQRERWSATRPSLPQQHTAQGQLTAEHLCSSSQDTNINNNKNKASRYSNNSNNLVMLAMIGSWSSCGSSACSSCG